MCQVACEAEILRIRDNETSLRMQRAEHLPTVQHDPGRPSGREHPIWQRRHEFLRLTKSRDCRHCTTMRMARGFVPFVVLTSGEAVALLV